MQTIKLSPTLSLEWSATFAAPGLSDEATGIDVDSDGNVYVSGTITDENGNQIMVLIAYDANGTELWVKKRLPQDSEGTTKGKDVKVTSDDKVVIVGEETKDGNTDILAIQYSTDGDKKWEKKTDGGGNDKAAKVQLDASGDIYVTGKTSDGTTESYTTVKYSTFDKPKDVVMDSSGTYPLYLDNTFIVKFDPAAMITDNINALEKTWGKPEFFLKPDKLAELEDSLGFSLKDVTFIRMFKHLRTTDTISISRLGEEIPIPKFWSAFMLVIPESWDTPTTINAFNTAYPVVHYAEYNRIIVPWSDCELELGVPMTPANDLLYGAQTSLDPYPQDVAIAPLDQVGINVEPAWCLETGKPHIRVGIMDSGLEFDHEDFATNLPDANGNLIEGNVVEGVWDFFNNSPMLTDADPFGHGTKVAGIIGAVRNNNTGIAGIAGGDHQAGNQGVTLQGYRILNDIDGGIFENQFGVSDMTYVVDAVFMASTDATLQTIDYPFQKPVHILNHSWGIQNATPGWTDINIKILRSIMHYSSRNKVVNVASRGNGDNFPWDWTSYPACYEDSWVINVGGTGENGSYKYEANGPSFGWAPLTGDLIDVAAPSSKNMIRTTDPDNGYTNLFHKTSAAAPHVAGAAALMLSYWNNEQSINSNLAPEDVEFLMENTATDAMIPLNTDNYEIYAALYDIPGPDEFIGHGRLNTGKLIGLLEHDRFDLRHYEMVGGSLLSPIQTIENVHVINNAVENHLGQPLNMGTGYTVEVYQFESQSIFPLLASELSPSEQVVTLGLSPFEAQGIWPRHSSSNILGSLSADLILSDAEQISYNSSSGKWSGNVYHLSLVNGYEIGWIPFDPTGPSDAIQFAFSVLVENLTVGIQDETEKEMVTLYPNPGTGRPRIKFSGNSISSFKLEVFDLQGRLMVQESAIESDQTIDLDNLSAGMYNLCVKTKMREYNLNYIKY